MSENNLVGKFRVICDLAKMIEECYRERDVLNEERDELNKVQLPSVITSQDGYEKYILDLKNYEIARANLMQSMIDNNEKIGKLADDLKRAIDVCNVWIVYGDNGVKKIADDDGDYKILFKKGGSI